MRWKKFNDWIAVKMTTSFGSMNAFWTLLALVLIPLLPMFSNTMSTIQFISSGIIQLVALPLILTGQNLIGASSEKRAIEDHEKLIKQFEEIKQVHNLNKQSIDEIKATHEDLHHLMSVIKSYMEPAKPKSKRKSNLDA